MRRIGLSLAGIAFVAATAAALLPAQAIAQDQPAAAGPEITVTAPRHTFTNRGTGIPMEEVSLSARVSYRDLDLKTAAGRTTLDGRVGAAAQDLCRKLEVIFPEGGPDAGTCAREAQRAARKQVEAAVAKAI